MTKQTAKLPEDFKVCEMCRYYDPEYSKWHGGCTKHNTFVLPVDTCDDWRAIEDDNDDGLD
jgi:hypothetical protein